VQEEERPWWDLGDKAEAEAGHIEMPPDPVDATAAARLAAEAAHEQVANMGAYREASADAWRNSVDAADATREAAEKAAAENATDAADLRDASDLADAAADANEAMLRASMEVQQEAVDAAALADAAVEATSAIDEGWRKAEAITDLEDAAGDARAASTAAWNDVTKAIADGDPDALEDALDASKLADAAAEATRAVADGYTEAVRLDAATDAAGGGTAYDQEHLGEDVSGGFEEVGQDIWTDDGY
jgi:hypothetical protein